MKIKYKLGIISFGLTAIIVVMFLATWFITSQQKSDGLVINLAGRQRMLTQKIVKEVLFLERARESKISDNQEMVDKVKNTMQVFDSTLIALRCSGKAPLSLNFKESKFRYCPKAEGPASKQLKEVATLWGEFSDRVNLILNNDGDTKDNVQWLAENNMSLLKVMNKAVGIMQKQSEAKIKKLLFIQMVCIVFGMLATVIAVITIVSIVKRFEQIKTFAIKLGSGDLTTTSGLTGVDEFGLIGTNLDAMANSLRDMFTQISDNTLNLSKSSSGLSKISAQMSKGAEDVSGRSNTVAVASEEMSSNMNSVAAAMEQAATNINIVSSSAEQITESIGAIAKNTERARSVTAQAVSDTINASERIDELGSAAKEIGKVTEAITEISEQTNLLALNATIEAARAGEAGKGFAVVANEIKELANQTAEATEEIRSKIDGIQGSTGQTVSEIEKITKVINEVNDIVSTITLAIEEQTTTTREIVGNVVQASQGIAEVNENVAQTSMVSGEIAKDISMVNRSSVEMSERSVEVSGNAKELSSLSDELKEMISHFKI